MSLKFKFFTYISPEFAKIVAITSNKAGIAILLGLNFFFGSLSFLTRNILL